MLETIIKVLTYINDKKMVGGIMSFLFGSMLLLWFALIGLDLVSNRRLFNPETSTGTTLTWAIAILFISVMIKIIRKNYRAGMANSILFADTLALLGPILVATGATIEIVKDKFRIDSLFDSENIILAFPLLILYPLCYLLVSFPLIASKKLFQRVYLFSKRYNPGVFLIIAAVLVINFFVYLASQLDNIRDNDVVPMLVVCSLVAIAFSILFSALYSQLAPGPERKLRSVILAGLLGFLISLAPSLTLWGSHQLLTHQIEKARKILSEEGENQFGYTKAQKLPGLEKAFVTEYKEKGRSYDQSKKQLFSKIFDDTLENSVTSKVDMNDFRNLRSNETTALAKDKNAAVLLTYAEYDSQLHPDINVLETKVTYEFQNTKTNNQEVVFQLRLPKSDSVVSDLKLGLNLEKQGQIAPRGAAERVYQESMQRLIDPALISQIGPNLYRLRVYPVLSKTDQASQGRQKVQITYLTPLTSQDELVTAPAIETLNLSITDTTKAMVRVRQDDRLLQEESISSGQEAFFADSHTLKSKPAIDDKKLCLTLEDQPKFLYYDYAPVNNGIDANPRPVYSSSPSFPWNNYLSQQGFAKDKELKEQIIFFDISRSAGQHEDSKKIYAEIVKAFRDDAVPFSTYYYNFAVYPATNDLSGLEFWGYTNTGKVIEYLAANKISGKKILIVTDDSNFEFDTKENKNIDYQILSANSISLLQVGTRIRAQKDELTKAVLASGGTMQVVQTAADVPSRYALLKDHGRFTPLFENCDLIDNELPERPLIQKIQAGQVNNLLLGKIKDEQTRTQFTEKANTLTKQYPMVNLFHSFIALETQQQQRDLDRYSTGSGRYDTNYENFDLPSSGGGIMIPMGGREQATFNYSNPLSAPSGFDPLRGSGSTSLSAGSPMRLGRLGGGLLLPAGLLMIVVFIVVFVVGFIKVKNEALKPGVTKRK